jgi:hypothetical protein
MADAAMNTGATVTQTKLAGPYKLVLDIGPLEQMWTPEQVKTKHPKHCEVMFTGTMVMGGMNGMGGPMPNHHLELHVFNRSSGRVVTKAMVSITITTPGGIILTHVPIATMQDVVQGPSDFHFGNNVALKNGQYHVLTQVQTTKATFAVTIGGSSMRM